MRVNEPGGTIRWLMHLAVPPEVVFSALDSDEGRRAFWAQSAEEIEGYINFLFINGQNYRSKIILREAPNLFVIDYFNAEARFELSSDGSGGTDVQLSHKGVGHEDWHEVYAGWLNVLFPLKAYVVHGVDLRNHDPTRIWDLGYADQ